MAELARQLNRSKLSVISRARRLKINLTPAWSEKDDRKLRAYWGDTNYPRLAVMFKRSQQSIFWRAGVLGLPRGCPDGFEYITNAASRTGYAKEVLRKILVAQGVRIGRSISRHGYRGKYHNQIVDPDEVDDAIARYRQHGTLNELAREYKMSAPGLEAWLDRGRARGMNVPERPRKLKAKEHWRLPRGAVAEVMSWAQSMETLSQAQIRVGVNRTTLQRRLMAAGVEPYKVGRAWYVPKTAVDRVVAKEK